MTGRSKTGWAWILGAALSLLGCAEGGALCDVNTDCEEGLVCVARRCVDWDAGPDAGSDPPEDAGTDAEPPPPIPDAGPPIDGGEGCLTGGCDDGNPCTDDRCLPAGCVHVANDAACDDGRFCNGVDQCTGGSCGIHSGNPCEVPTSCDPAAGGGGACVGCGSDADCPDPLATEWGACDGFDGLCDEGGTQSRTVTSFACVEGVCRGTPVTETQGCARDQEGVACGSTSCGDFGACEATGDICAEAGERSRTCADLVCQDGLCAEADREEAEACTRTTDGVPCAGGCGACGAGSCAASDPLAGMGWQALGGALSAGTGETVGRPDVALDGCDPVVAWTENNQTHVARWTGSSWAPMGGPLDYVTTTTWATGARIAARDGVVVVIWAELDGSTRPYAASWDGSAWTRLGDRLPSGDMNSFEMDVAIDDDGRPWVAWNASPASGPAEVFVARWTGSAWVAVGAGLSAESGAGSDALAPTLTFDDGGAPIVAWQESSTLYLRRWSGTSWEPVAGGTRDRLTGSTSAFDAHLAAVDGGFVLGWRENNGAETHVNADRWNGSTWVVLASNVDATPSVNTGWMDLATDSMGRAVVVWEEPDGAGTSQVHARRHETALVDLGAGVLSAVGGDTDAGQPHVTVDGLDRPVVAFSEESTAGGPRAVRVYRYH